MSGGRTPGASGGGSGAIATHATYAAALAALPGKPAQLVQVTADETNDGQTTLYQWTGAALNWLPTVGG